MQRDEKYPPKLVQNVKPWVLAYKQKKEFIKIE